MNNIIEKLAHKLANASEDLLLKIRCKTGVNLKPEDLAEILVFTASVMTAAVNLLKRKREE